MKFADCGGNENISINDEFLNVAQIIDIDGQVLGGVTISVNAVEMGNQWKGTIELHGTINSFRIGGQELWIDDVKY